MEIVWSNEKIQQYYQYIHMAREIQIGFFQKIRAIILPEDHPEHWYFPDYHLFKNPEFVRRLKSVDENETTVIDPRLVQMVSGCFDLHTTTKDFQKDKLYFDKIKRQLLDTIAIIFPVISKVKTITIIPIKFGTPASFRVEKNRIYLYYKITPERPTELVKVLIHSLVQLSQPCDQNEPIQWIKRQAIADFLANNTSLSRFTTPNCFTTLEMLEKKKTERTLSLHPDIILTWATPSCLALVP